MYNDVILIGFFLAYNRSWLWLIKHGNGEDILITGMSQIWVEAQIQRSMCKPPCGTCLMKNHNHYSHAHCHEPPDVTANSMPGMCLPCNHCATCFFVIFLPIFKHCYPLANPLLLLAPLSWIKVWNSCIFLVELVEYIPML